MDNASVTESLPTFIDASSTSVLAGKRLSIYIAVGAVLLIAWLLQPSKPHSSIEAPFYKASKSKWIFDAESLIKDSYRKVCLGTVQLNFDALLTTA